VQLQLAAKLLLISRPAAAAQAASKRRIVPEFALLVADPQELRRQHSLCIPVDTLSGLDCLRHGGAVFQKWDPSSSLLILPAVASP